MKDAPWNGPNTGEAYQCMHGRMFGDACPAEKHIDNLEARVCLNCPKKDGEIVTLRGRVKELEAARIDDSIEIVRERNLHNATRMRVERAEARVKELRAERETDWKRVANLETHILAIVRRLESLSDPSVGAHAALTIAREALGRED